MFTPINLKFLREKKAEFTEQRERNNFIIIATFKFSAPNKL